MQIAINIYLLEKLLPAATVCTRKIKRTNIKHSNIHIIKIRKYNHSFRIQKDFTLLRTMLKNICT